MEVRSPEERGKTLENVHTADRKGTLQAEDTQTKLLIICDECWSNKKRGSKQRR